ncbi:hypothetical protein JOH49_000977 [Bradyrhizobium elkanii]|uniref:Uncharacterized protein n=1 Tax=Bradyrhizobium elkanii TaxID=29448 RepID=A0A8I1Y398_BRAEL|nr:hypothetical protein [Bradyrhizobium elkanii]
MDRNLHLHQRIGHELGGAVLLERGFRIGMDVMAPIQHAGTDIVGDSKLL